MTSLADELLPAYDVLMHHAIDVAAPAPVVWDALHRADFAAAWYVRALLMLRGPVERKHFVDTSVNAVYWYFVVGSWVVLYAVVFLSPRLF